MIIQWGWAVGNLSQAAAVWTIPITYNTVYLITASLICNGNLWNVPTLSVYKDTLSKARAGCYGGNANGGINFIAIGY